MSADAPRISFEFFPPKTVAGRERLFETARSLQSLNPAFCSVTYGAGGSTRDHTRDIVLALQREGITAAPHLSFGGDEGDTVLALLNTYREAGIDRIVALRGDLPSGVGDSRQLVYARELVAFIRRHTGDHFHLEVAAYPEYHPDAPGAAADIDFLKAKLDAGANSAITQYFYHPWAYTYFMQACTEAGIDRPIVPGIMPITNVASLLRFSDNCGADIPRWLRYRLRDLEDDPVAVRDFGLDVVTRLCEDLLAQGAPGLHFYTLNQSGPATEILRRLGLAH